MYCSNLRDSGNFQLILQIFYILLEIILPQIFFSRAC